MSVEVRGLTQRFGAFVALDDVSLNIPSGELVALLGPSGSGKTTLLRTIAGLEPPGAGTVLFEGEDVSRRSLADRRVGFVFQHYALFRNMSVFENVAFGLRARPRQTRPSNSEIAQRVNALLSLMQLDGYARRRPHQLSGGQRQRVALARALAIEPRVLLLDEPFGALDAQVRQELRRWLRRLHDELHVTSVFVTHDQEEAFEVADRVVVMLQGRIEQVGSPREVYDTPASPFVCEFLGGVNQFDAHVDQGKVWLADGVCVDAPEHADVHDRRGVAYVRATEVDVCRQPSGSASLETRVSHVSVVGPVLRLQLERLDNAGRIEVELPRSSGDGLALQAGERVWMHPRAVRVFLT